MSEFISIAILPREGGWYATVIVRETAARNGRPRTLGRERAIYVRKDTKLDVQAACVAIRRALEEL